MNIQEIKKKVSSDTYAFLKENEHLGSNIILLGLGGSHAYGTNTESSDLDIRGIATNRKEEILSNIHFDHFVNEETDTTIYSFNKMITLLSNCNPNTIELLGLKPEHYLYISPIGQELLNNAHMFLSKKCVQSFGGYANSQLRRLDNKAVRLVGQAERENHILNSIKNAFVTFPDKYFPFNDGDIKLYIDKAVQEDYSKIWKCNKHAIEHEKLGKHMMHLVRLFYMCFDILENEKIFTYREKEHELLMDIRNGKYLDENRQPIPEFFELVDELEKRLEYDKGNTSLPDKPDYKKINDFVISVNEHIVKGEL